MLDIHSFPKKYIFSQLIFLFSIVGSLGGGLAMITGAQTQRPAVALSGPNNVLSRKSFSPSLSKEDLDRLTFNIIPDRDPVAMSK